MGTRAVFLTLLAAIGVAAAAGAAQVELYYFWSATCPDCQIMWEFLRGLAEEYPELVINDYEVTFNPDNWRLMVSLAKAYGLEEGETPTVIVGNLVTTGIGRAVELRIREEVERCLTAGCPSPLDRLPQQTVWRLSPLEALFIILIGLAVFFYLTG